MPETNGVDESKTDEKLFNWRRWTARWLGWSPKESNRILRPKGRVENNGGKDTRLCGETRPLLLPKYYRRNKYFYNRTTTKLSKKSIESM